MGPAMDIDEEKWSEEQNDSFSKCVAVFGRTRQTF